MTDIYRSTITTIGEGTQDMFDAGVYILFGEPVPPALADISVVHAGAKDAAPDIRPGDKLLLGGAEIVIDEVGDIANKNIAELGHAVVYLNSPGQKLLPGAIKASSEQTPQPAVGQELAFVREG